MDLFSVGVSEINFRRRIGSQHEFDGLTGKQRGDVANAVVSRATGPQEVDGIWYTGIAAWVARTPYFDELKGIMNKALDEYIALTVSEVLASGEYELTKACELEE